MWFRNRQPRVERLARIPLFVSCTRKQLCCADSLITELEVESGRVLQREDVNASAFCVIESGQAMVSVAGRCVGELHAGQFFGEVGLLDRSPSLATVTAATRVVVFVLSAQEFRALIDAAPAVSFTIMQASALHMRSVEGDLVKRSLEPQAHTGPNSVSPVAS